MENNKFRDIKKYGDISNMGKLDNLWTIGKFGNIVRGAKWEKLEIWKNNL